MITFTENETSLFRRLQIRSAEFAGTLGALISFIIFGRAADVAYTVYRGDSLDLSTKVEGHHLEI
jgi:hypothetical protein